MKKFWVNKSFLATGHAIFLDEQMAKEDEIVDEPYVTSHECTVSDEEYKVVCEYVKSQGKEKICEYRKILDKFEIL